MIYKQRPLAIVGSIHGNEPLGALTVESLPNTEGIVSIVGHPDAVKSGERYLGDEGEMGGLFPGDFASANPDRRQAAVLHTWLTAHNPWLTLSIHSNTNTGANNEYTSLHAATTPAAVAVASCLGFSVVNVNDTYAFTRCHPGMAETEHVIRNTSEANDTIIKLVEASLRINSLGQTGMTAIAESSKDGLVFYQKIGHLMLTGKNALPSNVVRDLEQTVTNGDGSRFSPVELSTKVARALNVEGYDLRIGSWNYRNGSKLMAGFSSYDGAPRRECFGSLSIALDPPKLNDEGMYVFKTYPSID